MNIKKNHKRLQYLLLLTVSFYCNSNMLLADDSEADKKHYSEANYNEQTANQSLPFIRKEYDSIVPIVDLSETSNKKEYFIYASTSERSQKNTNINSDVESVRYDEDYQDDMILYSEELNSQSRLKDNSNLIDSQEAIMHKSSSDNSNLEILQQQVIQLQKKIDLLEDKFESLGKTINSIIKEGRERHIDIDDRFTILRNELQKVKVQSTVEVTDDNDLTKSLNFAKVLVKDKKYHKARDILLKIKEDFPLSRNKSHLNSADIFEAYYWLAEIDISLENFDSALNILKDMGVYFKNHERISEILYKTGYLLKYQGKHTEAYNVLKSIIDKYPNSSSAKLANKMLKQERIANK